MSRNKSDEFENKTNLLNKLTLRQPLQANKCGGFNSDKQWLLIKEPRKLNNSAEILSNVKIRLLGKEAEIHFQNFGFSSAEAKIRIKIEYLASSFVKLQEEGPNLELTLLSHSNNNKNNNRFSKIMALSGRNQTTRAIAKLRS